MARIARYLANSFNKHNCNFLDVRKIASLSLHKIKAFRNKGYDAIISIHDAINKILLRDSNYIVDVVM